MGNFEKLSVLVIVVIIVMILVVALYTWTDNPDTAGAATDAGTTTSSTPASGMSDSAGGFPPAPPAGRTPMVNPQTGAAGGGLATLPAGINPLGTTGTSTGTARAGAGGTTSGGLGAPAATTDATAADTTPSEPRVHVVASGDNLTKIAKKYFSSTSQRYVDAIAKANPTLDPNRLRVNQKLTIPSDKDVAAAPARASSPDSGTGGGSGSVTTSTSGSGPKAGSTYTVRRGDKLPDIARRAYGSTENWHLIWLENFTTIRDPDEVAVGTRLKIPHVH